MIKDKLNLLKVLKIYFYLINLNNFYKHIVIFKIMILYYNMTWKTNIQM